MQAPTNHLSIIQSAADALNRLPNENQRYREGQQMKESRPESGPEAISRFRAVVVAGLRVKQLRRGSKPRIELDGKKHKDTCIAMEEVRRGLISFRESALPLVHEPNGVGDSKAGVEEALPVIQQRG